MSGRRVEVSYEGMGTCVEATIRLGGKTICSIYTNNAQTNRLTDEIITVAKNHLLKKEKQRYGKKHGEQGESK